MEMPSPFSFDNIMDTCKSERNIQNYGNTLALTVSPSAKPTEYLSFLFHSKYCNMVIKALDTNIFNKSALRSCCGLMVVCLMSIRH